MPAELPQPKRLLNEGTQTSHESPERDSAGPFGAGLIFEWLSSGKRWQVSESRAGFGRFET